MPTEEQKNEYRVKLQQYWSLKRAIVEGITDIENPLYDDLHTWLRDNFSNEFIDLF